MEYSVVIPAAGQGKRMRAGKNKQFLELKGEPLIVHTLRLFDLDPLCRQIVLVANQDEIAIMQDIRKDYQIKKVCAVIEGGKERQDSVRNGLNFFREEQIVLVHDGARPFVTYDVINKLVRKAEEMGAAICAVPVKDTIKRVIDGVVIETQKREELWSVQTPQAFKWSLIIEAHEQANKENMIGTDDASLVEWIGKEVAIVEGDYQNIKLTTPEDLLFAEAILTEKEKK
ncbi:2-C-methyl-D-erythritol 4-phosphate cytidylyltransferase [Halalkalibacter akibai]|uniref:2-C-methyl-D-erythritol 4-phosphate cytidylyltransferase n=1 Tax=Halalkalibacter akibai (strain ATCC 43226 / DSM 21942 / CIP 109018 / JCM 9157 / 1139) TaxID=1236973 RepID=W4QTQ3_HALA3|nr:2-C-methyl-D-erythritol 4-phosphate cytidylyltransferase [Halalkalibacter akibai]GAE35302.1 2-C-methyl-D-erythritol 4-phosphate cytidylyltransferase [Halalkalibacter akibai JCM 9157]